MGIEKLQRLRVTGLERGHTVDRNGVTPQRIERWLPAAKWEWCIEVSDLGRVRSIERIAWRKNGRPYRVRGQLLAQSLNGNGYWSVEVRYGGQKIRLAVHRLVLETFAGPCPAGQQSLHGPGGKLDNRWPENLRWGTPPENAADRDRDGTTARGERNGLAKLTEATVRECRLRYAAGEPSLMLAAEFGVSRKALNDALRGRTWKHADGPLANHGVRGGTARPLGCPACRTPMG